MACEFICDGCGKREKGVTSWPGLSWAKPRDWYERRDKDGTQTACSRECISVVAARTGKTDLVLPI